MFNYDAFNRFFNDVTLDSLEQLECFYHPDVEFIDPAHRLKGVEEIRQFWLHLLDTVNSCQTDIISSTRDGSRCYSRWNMRFQHPKLKRGKQIEVAGMSELKISGEKVILHRDFYCMGELLYEHIPVLGGIVRSIKRGSQL